MATFFEEKGVNSAKDASIAKDFYLSIDEERGDLENRKHEYHQLHILQVPMLILAIFQVSSKPIGKAASKLARKAIKKGAISEAVGFALGFAAGQTAGVIANFLDKIICNLLSVGQKLGALNLLL